MGQSPRDLVLCPRAVCLRFYADIGNVEKQPSPPFSLGATSQPLARFKICEGIWHGETHFRHDSPSFSDSKHETDEIQCPLGILLFVPNWTRTLSALCHTPCGAGNLYYFPFPSIVFECWHMGLLQQGGIARGILSGHPDG